MPKSMHKSGSKLIIFFRRAAGNMSFFVPKHFGSNFHDGKLFPNTLGRIFMMENCPQTLWDEFFQKE
jgi:hypothetical protein